MSKATISFRVDGRVKELYDNLSSEDKEKIKYFVELLVKVFSSGYNVEVRERQERSVVSSRPVSHELVRSESTIAVAPLTASTPSGILQRIFREWYQALIDQGFIPGQLYKCHELQAVLVKKGVKEYALEMLVKQGYIVRDGDECVLK